MDIKQLRLGNIIDIYTNENSEVAEVFELHEKSFQAEQPNYMVGGVEYDGIQSLIKENSRMKIYENLVLLKMKLQFNMKVKFTKFGV